MSIAGLEDAAIALDALAAGMVPDRARVIAGALAMDTLILFWRWASRDLLDAAAGRRVIATGGSLDLDEAGRRRARHLAEAVRECAPAAPPTNTSASNRHQSTGGHNEGVDKSSPPIARAASASRRNEGRRR